MTKYMHTLNGKPANIDPWGLALFAGGRNRVELRDTLKEIRKDQQRARRYDSRQGRDGRGWKHGYVLVRV